MADKDTREDSGTADETMPLPDGPRSEGGPAPRAAPDVNGPDDISEVLPAETEPIGHDDSLAAQAPDDIPPSEGDWQAEAREGMPDPDVGPAGSPVEEPHHEIEARQVEDSPVPQELAVEDAHRTDEPATEEPPPAETRVSWHTAIAEALGEPAADLPPHRLERDGEPANEQPTHPSDMREAAAETFVQIADVDAPRATPADLHEPEPARRPAVTLIPIRPPTFDRSSAADTGTKSAEPAESVPSRRVEPSEISEEAESRGIDPEIKPEATPDSQSDRATFTDAVQDLFRPAESERPDETHLITIGRRLDPSLRISRPVPPIIEPRPEPAPTVPAGPTWADGTWQDRARIAGRYAAYAAAGYLALVLVLIVLFRFIDPPGSMLMLSKLLRGNAIDRTWVPLEAISPALVRAVIVSEDDRFCEHYGIDLLAMRQAIAQSGDGVPRGASTISMQVIKNLFLWSSKSYIRKIIEIPLTLVMELLWSKRRIVEVYLNIAEWGPGVFGAEAAARSHFGKSASGLGERESALLAATLPNPVMRIAGSPGPQTERKARVVQSRVKAYGSVASCVVGARSETSTSPAVRRSPLRTAPRRKKVDDWGSTLQFGN